MKILSMYFIFVMHREQYYDPYFQNKLGPALTSRG